MLQISYHKVVTKLKMGSTIFAFSNHRDVKPFLKTQQRKQSFDNLMHFIVGVAVQNRRDLDMPFQIPVKLLNRYHYERFMQPLFIYMERVGSYSIGENGKKGECYHYLFKDEFFKANFKFTDTQTKSNSIDYNFNAEAVNMAKNTLNEVSIKSYNVQIVTAKQANYHLNTFLTSNITPQYVAKRLSLDRANKTYMGKGIVIPITEDIDLFLERKVKAAQFSGGYILNELRQGHFYCSCSPTNGRTNNSFTSLAEVLTQYIRIEDESIKGFDLSNSQFLLLSHLLENCLPSSNKRLFKFISENGFDNHYLGKGAFKYKVSTLIKTLEHVVLNQEKSSDFQRFLKESFEGTLYDSFATKMKTERPTAKIAFFAILFGKCKTSEHAKAFKKEYPSVFEITNKFKDLTDYSVLSVFLQKIESLVFIETLHPLCYFSNLKTLTKHDSIYSKTSDYKKMLKIVEPFFNSLFENNYNRK